MPDSTKIAPNPIERIKPPSITVRLGTERIVFLVTDIQEPPELDVYAPQKCQMRFHLLPGLLLTPPAPAVSLASQEVKTEAAQFPAPHEPNQIVCPLLLDHMTLAGKAQILQAAMENENPFYGLSMFAKILAIPEYMELVPPKISARLPYGLVKELFPDEARAIVASDEEHSMEGGPTPGQAASLHANTLIEVNFALPTGHPLPELYRGKIVRISLSLYARAGGLALNNRSPLLVNSRSRPTRIHISSTSAEMPADGYYQLRGIGSTLPVTSSLPDFYEDYTDVIDPGAAYLARRGINL